MAKIPDPDILAAVEKVFARNDLKWPDMADVARLVMNERKRCAGLARKMRGVVVDDVVVAREQIAEAIEAGNEAP